MGMFDNIIFEPPTPDGWKPLDSSFQTKSLENDLVTHRVDRDGRFIRQTITDCKVVPPEERPFAKDQGVKHLFGSLKMEYSEAWDQEFTGTIDFYASEMIEDPDGNAIKMAIGSMFNPREEDLANSVDGKKYRLYFHDYTADFIQGCMMGLKLTKPQNLEAKDKLLGFEGLFVLD